MKKRSKSEKHLFKLIKENMPEEKILANDRKIIGLEIDICFPKRKIAIEWNGFLHRNPLFGETHLKRVQFNDHKKKTKLLKDGWTVIIVEDYDSKNPIQYSKKVFGFLKKFIEKEIKEKLIILKVGKEN
jgi:very-short-patch-repair endonuclease